MKQVLILQVTVAAVLCHFTCYALLTDPGGTNFNILDAGDRGCNSKSKCSDGMVTWSVSEPYVNLWLADAPVSYSTSLGEKISFQLFYKQRDSTPPHANKFQAWFLSRGATSQGQLPTEFVPPLPPPPYVPVTGWNHNWFSYIRFSGTYKLGDPNAEGIFREPWQEFGAWRATLFVPGGGTIDFQNADGFYPSDVPNNPHVTQAALQPMTQFLDGVTQPIYPATTNGPTSVPYGCPNIPGLVGFRLVHSDGSMDLYGKVTPVYPNTAVADALWTEHIDPYGNSLHFYYTNVVITNVNSYLLSHVVDYDGRTNYLTYNAKYLLERVDMPYGRHATFEYDFYGNLKKITDAIGLVSEIEYQPTLFGTVDEPVTLTTPYGVTHFDHFDAGSFQGVDDVGNVGGTNRINRAIWVTHPNHSPQSVSRELFLYRFDASAQGIPQAVNDAPYSPIATLDNAFDSSETNLLRNLSALYTRNSFHWGPRQYALLSTNLVTEFTTNDYRLATMTHWLARDANHLSDTPSMIQQPSPDGIKAGTRLWFDYAGKSLNKPWLAGSGQSSAVCQLLPNDATRYVLTSLNPEGLPDSVTSTYERPEGGIGQRVVTYQYEGVSGRETCAVDENQISEATWSYPSLSAIYGPDSQPLFSLNNHTIETTTRSFGNHDFTTTRPQRRELTVTDGENQTSTIWHNQRQQWIGARLFNDVLLTNYYNPSGWPAETVNLSADTTNRWAFEKGLISVRTNALGLVSRYAWDDLERLLTVRFPDDTGVTNSYWKLHLNGQHDRLGHFTFYDHDDFGKLTGIVDAESRPTDFDYCACGALETVTDSVGGSTRIRPRRASDGHDRFRQCSLLLSSRFDWPGNQRD